MEFPKDEVKNKIVWTKGADFTDGSPRYTFEGRDPATTFERFQVVIYTEMERRYQLQKDVTHQLSRFLVNRRDDKADLSDVVHIFFRSGLFSHGVLLSQMQNKIIVLPVVHWESKQASTLAGCWPAAYDLGTKCPKVFLKGRSAAPAPVGLS